MMKNVKWCMLVVVVMVIVPCSLFARDIAPIVSTDWLETNLNNSKLKILDIRKIEEYKEGHIPGALSSFYGAWAPKKGNNQNELPSPDDLTDLIQSNGVTDDSLIVIVGKSDSELDLVGITRVAWTLAYAGIMNVSVLDGGYNKWESTKKPVSKEAAKAAPSAYQPKWNMNILATKDYVLKMMKQSLIVDTRAPEVFFGISKMDFVEKAGHIPGSICLPTGWMYMKDGTFRTKEDREAMVSNVLGKDKSKEIIAICDTGKLCSAMWFILTEDLGYRNVKIYDGAMEEWTRDPKAPVDKYSW